MGRHREFFSVAITRVFPHLADEDKEIEMVVYFAIHNGEMQEVTKAQIDAAF